MTVDTAAARIRWTPIDVHAIFAAGLRDLAAEHAEAGDVDGAHALSRLAAIQEAALLAERDEHAARLARRRCALGVEVER